MKHVILLALIGVCSSFASAQVIPPVKKIISDETYDINITMNPTTVQCLVGDYSASSLKIVVPELKWYTSLDHTSTGAAGPCITAGACNGSFGSGKDSRLPLLTDATRPFEDIKLRVVKSEVFQRIPENNICSHTYLEEVSSTIRGIDFKHQRSIELSTLDLAHCK